MSKRTKANISLVFVTIFWGASCILCSVAFAFHIILTNKFVSNCDPLTIGVYQLGFVCLYGTVFSLAFETPTLPTNTFGWTTVLILSLLCSGFAFIVQTLAQRHTTATHTGLIYSLEPLFAAIIAYLVLKETLTNRGYIGAFFLVSSIILMEVEIKKFRSVDT